VATILHTLDVSIPAPSEPISLTVAPLIGPADGQPARIRRREGPRNIDPRALYEERIQIRSWDESLELPEFVTRSVDAGAAIITQGDAAEEFFIILDGHASVWERSEDGVEKQVNTLGPGQAFGEIGILKRTRRTATVRAADRVQLLVLDRDTFLDLAAELDEDAEHLARVVKDTFIARSLRKCLSGVRAEELGDLDEIHFEHFDRGQWIVREGDASDVAYVVVCGKVEVFCGTDPHAVALSTLAAGEIFGEIGVMEGCPRTASVKTADPTVVARLSRETLMRLLEESDAAASSLRLLVARRLMRSIERLKA
jgi:CRP-like cAMP-binding protein